MKMFSSEEEKELGTKDLRVVQGRDDDYYYSRFPTSEFRI